MSMNDVADILVHVAWAEIAAFVALYKFRSRWRGTTVGRWVMAHNVAMLAVVSLGLVAQHLTDWVARPSVRVATWVLVVAVFGWQLWLLVREQRDVRRPGRAIHRRPGPGD